jgi:glycosyltransferase involved in cell wall biosynthesis
MRIFYAVSPTPNADALKGSHLWDSNLYPPLLELGHEVVRFQYDFTHHIRYVDTLRADHRVYIDQHRPTLEKHLLDEITTAHRQQRIDLFFSYFYDACITPETLHKIKQLGILTVNFFCNNVHQFHMIETLAPHYDYNMIPEREALATYANVGARTIHAQMAANPLVYKPYPEARRYNVTFVGQSYLNRHDYLLHLYRHGIDVEAFGPNWRLPHLFTPKERFKRLLRPIKYRLTGVTPTRQQAHMLPIQHLHPALSDLHLIKLYSQSAISLGFSEVKHSVTGEIKRHIRLREFEAPMSGAFYFTGYQEELHEYYEVGKEIVCYDTPDELLDKVRYYLAHPTEADRIREAGLARARRDHTWKNRFEAVFKAIQAG